MTKPKTLEPVSYTHLDVYKRQDRSRMGRDYLKVGQIMEILRQRGVRLIAINDGVDSARGDDDFTPFRNIIDVYKRQVHSTSKQCRRIYNSDFCNGVQREHNKKLNNGLPILSFLLCSLCTPLQKSLLYIRRH